ncbi:MAG: DUF4102 domain-containing protein, partial [Proteobacteria bacterium]|nr:DUF4102 domain-containing protein [Pseudomonadota bacterium]
MRNNKTLLTFKRIEGSKPGIEMADPTCPGLRFIHDKNGLRYWQYRYRNTAGVLRRMTLGHFPAIGIKDARGEWADQKRLRRQGLDPLDVRAEKMLEEHAKTQERQSRRQRDSYTVARLIDDYLDYQETRIKSWRKVGH